MNCFHYTPGYLSLSRKNLSWHKNNFHSFPHISLLSTLALLKNWGIVFLPAAPRPAFSSNHTPQSVGRKLTTLRERTVRIRKVDGSIPFGSTKKEPHLLVWLFYLSYSLRKSRVITIISTALSLLSSRFLRRDCHLKAVPGVFVRLHPVPGHTVPFTLIPGKIAEIELHQQMARDDIEDDALHL